MRRTLLHLGIAWRDLPAAWINLGSYRATLHADRWDAWGEPLQSDPMTPFAHITVIATSREHDEIIATLGDVLCGDPAGTWIAAETTLDDWSVEDAGGRIWHRLETPNGPIVIVELHPWRIAADQAR